MLSEQEKMEILHDAGCLKRRAAFRQAQIKANHPSYDAYLKFLSGIQNLFRRAEKHLTGHSRAGFKL